MKNSKLIIRPLILTFVSLHIAFLIGCSQPVLESQECTVSRDVVKKFYSYHIGNEMKPSADNLAKRSDYLSSELFKKLSSRVDTKTDYFTQTDDYPKAFRAGSCENAGKDTTRFEILLFWRNNEKNIQREIEVEAIKENDKWLINKVTSKE